jgi:hypothetical protein
MRINFREIPDSSGGDFGTLPMGKYPALLKVDGYQHDAQGNFALNGEGKKVYWTTGAGDAKWNLMWEILNLDGNRRLLDNLNFSKGGSKRVKVLYTRGGFAEGDEEDIDIEPEDLDGTYWWIDVDKHELRTDFARGGAVKESKYTFKAKDCKCEVCRVYDGQKVNVDARIGFAGFELMDPKDAAKFRNQSPEALRAATNAPNDSTICMPCNMGDHSHVALDGCPCLHVDHSLALCRPCVEGDHSHKDDPRLACPCEDEMHIPF